MKYLRRSWNLQQRAEAGDTIVEVLIAIAIVAAVLVGAFVVSNRSTAAVQESQEHAAAVQLLQSQLETLRGLVQQGNDTSTDSVPFCVDTSAPGEHLLSEPSHPCDNINHLYNVQIIRNNHTYNLQATWDGLRGNQNQIKLVYRVYGS